MSLNISRVTQTAQIRVSSSPDWLLYATQEETQAHRKMLVNKRCQISLHINFESTWIWHIYLLTENCLMIPWPDLCRSSPLLLEALWIKNQRWCYSSDPLGNVVVFCSEKQNTGHAWKDSREAWNPNVTVPVTVNRHSPPVISALPRLMACLTGWVPIT